MLKVSVVTPTFNRERFLPAFYAMYRAQTYPALELLVGDDSPVPSMFFSGVRDQGVRYTHLPTRVSIGEKRNRLIGQATGDVIVSFDDDDYYAPHYVEAMVQALGDADLVKLVGWYAYSVPEQALFYWDTTINHPVHFKVGNGPMAVLSPEKFGSDFVARNIDGYGFSYVARRSVLENVRFPDQNFGEDIALVGELRRSGCRISYVHDRNEIAVHLLHGRTTSTVFPQYRLPPGLEPRLFPGLVRHLALVKSR